jgi:hypothetical protein
MDATPERTSATARQRTLVWIDSEQAVIVRWNGAAKFIRIESDVPAHHRSTGHVAHDPMIRRGGGGGVRQEAGEGHRLEHLHRFISQVEARLGPEDEIEILGSGTVRERLAHLVETNDQRRGRPRHVWTHATGPLTDAQLVALLREAAGDPPRRGREGAPGFP